MSELRVNTLRPNSGQTLTVSNDTNLTISGTGKVTTPTVEAADLDINGTTTLELKHNGLTKVAVTTSGATVTGTVTATAFSGDGSALTGIIASGVGGASSTGNLQMISNSGGANGNRDIIFLDQNSEKARLYGATGNLAVDTDTLFVDATNDRVGIGKSNPASTLDVDGTATATAFVGPLSGNVTGNLTGNVTGNVTGDLTGNISGNTTVSGDLEVNGSDITTTATGTATVFNTNATTLNVGGAATTVSLGASTGTATVNNATFQFNSGYGSAATAYACRAWVNFQASSGTRNGSGNVSSVTDNGNGDHTVNLQNAMPDTNYSVSAIARKVNDLVDGAWTIQFNNLHTATTSAIRFVTVFSPVSTSPVLADGSVVFFQLFR